MDTNPGNLDITNVESLNDLIGPIKWDIEVEKNSEFWLYSVDVNACVESWMDCIQGIGRGIILMHDHCADDPNIDNCSIVRRGNNCTYDVLCKLIPILKSNGFHFVSLEQLYKK